MLPLTFALFKFMPAGRLLLTACCVAPVVFTAFLCEAAATTNAGKVTNTGKVECVILLHGLARTPNSMAKMKQRLSSEGFLVINRGYPSLADDVASLAQTCITNAVSACFEMKAGRIHFVTHSMGGILVRYYLKHHDLPEQGRVVMLSPPNAGNEIVDHINHIWGLRNIIGPGGRQLGTAPADIPGQLGPALFELGIITGDRSINPLFSWLVPGKDDGVVSIRNAQLPGMQDFLVIHATHPFIMMNRDAIEQTVFFLKYGQFQRSSCP